ncbi:MAG: phosphodiester glycosidase family protein [Bacteroidales bacterium]|jgi:hypothetical protein|nr:phosphodiester glycosidase family protein [Bacteroidales bacterium]MCI2122091.1 phosphodiester glycosidase family protein [Bacteroidales bacterium]MCI2145768.1 phosphodiester glycosidase family protein [Bacteroidales bacterium]
MAMHKGTLMAASLTMLVVSACTCSCNNKENYQFPSGKDSTGVNPVDTVVIPGNTETVLEGYPEGMKVVSFTDWLDADAKCVGWYAIVNTKAYPELRFNAMNLPDPMKPSEAFSRFSTLGKGTPLIAVNGGYWYNGKSLSLLVSDSTVQSIATQMAWVTVDGRNVTVYPVRAAFGLMSDGTYEATWVYCPSETGLQPYSYPSPLRNNEETHTFMSVPPKHNNYGATIWTPVEAIGGGPMVVKNGEDVADVNYWKEVLDEGGTAGLYREPRTAVGATSDGKIIVMVCDGRTQNGSSGFTLSEMARKFISLGAVAAVNLDGGGSSTFVSRDGTVLNRPSDSGTNIEISERNVSTVVVISVK